MHGQHLLLGQEVIHHGEDGLFDLPGILSAADEHQLLAEMNDNEDLRAGAVHFGNRVEVRGIDHRELRHVAGQLLGLGLDEHVAGEEIVPGSLGDHPDGQAISGVGPGEAVLDEKVFPLEIGQQPVLQGGKPLRCHGLVHLTPPDFVCTGGLLHHKLVIRGAPGILAGADH